MREPFQVLVIPYRFDASGTLQYGALKRSDSGVWQGVAGGGEDGESATDAAGREAEEELGVPRIDELLLLSTVSSIPKYHFSTAGDWPDDLFVISEYAFALDCTSLEVVLSAEHKEIQWSDFQTVHKLFEWDSNQTALWEANERLRLGIFEKVKVRKTS
jgi:dATP pyrophosphohydrolase